jgi:hypothetical protein
MTVEQLREELNQIQHPLNARNAEAIQRVFALYRTLTSNEPRGTGCYGCALDAYEELRTIESRGRGWDNSLNLPQELLNQFKKQAMESKLKKYRLIREFRIFGTPDMVTAYNVTDKQVDALLKSNPALGAHFEVLEKPVKEKAPTKEKAAKKAEAEEQVKNQVEEQS